MSSDSVLVLLALLLVGCTDGEVENSARLSLSVAQLWPLGDGAVYEAWLVGDENFTPMGTFLVDEEGSRQVELTADSSRVAVASGVLLSLESKERRADEPSSRRILAGDLVEGTAELGVDHPWAIGLQPEAKGTFVMDTPSTADMDVDYRRGIWFLQAHHETTVPSLDAPLLSEGWTYEGWVVGEEPISTGRFADPGQPDSDGAGVLAGDDPPPEVPGQDFVTDPLDLPGLTAIVTLEPVPDDDPGPTTLVLCTRSIDDPGYVQNQSLLGIDDSMPHGLVVVE